MVHKIKPEEEKYYALKDFELFCKRYFGIDLPAHQKIWEKICDEPGNILIYAPAAHGKTSVFSIMRTIWKICNDRLQRRIIASSTDELSTDILKTISYQLMNNTQLIEDYGPFYSPECEWTDSTIRVLIADYDMPPGAWKPSGKKDPTLRAIGVGTSCLGKRCDELICDDLLNLKNSKTEELRRTIRQWWWNELYPTVDSGGAIKFVGNPVHRDDLSQELAKDEDFKAYTFKAILDEEKQITLWPGRWSYRDLVRRRDKDPISFARRYQSLPVSDSDFVDWDKMAKCFRSDLVLREAMGVDELEKYKRVILAVDPAFTLHRRSSYSAILTLGIDGDNSIHLIGGWKGKVLVDDLKRIIKSKASAFNVYEVVVECNAQQWGLIRELELSMPDKKITPIFTGKKDDPEIGLSQVLKFFDLQKIILPYGDDKSRTLVDDLCNEIAEYPHGDHDDLYMALYHGVRNLAQVSNKQVVQRREIWRPRTGFRILGSAIHNGRYAALSKSTVSLRNS